MSFLCGFIGQRPDWYSEIGLVGRYQDGGGGVTGLQGYQVDGLLAMYFAYSIHILPWVFPLYLLMFSS
jgi:hypothetical protein